MEIELGLSQVARVVLLNEWALPNCILCGVSTHETGTMVCKAHAAQVFDPKLSMYAKSLLTSFY